MGAQAILYNEFENYTSKITATSPSGPVHKLIEAGCCI